MEFPIKTFAHGIICGACISFGTFYLFRNKIYSYISTTLANIVDSVLAHEKVVLRTQSSLNDIVNYAVYNEDWKNKLLNYIKIIDNEDTRNMLSSLIISILNDKNVQNIIMTNINQILNMIISDIEMRNNIHIYLHTILNQFLENKELQNKIISYLQTLLEDQKNKEIIVSYLMEITTDENVKKIFANFISEIASREDVIKALEQLLNNVVINNLKDQNLKIEVEGLLLASLKSNDLRDESADAIYQILKKLFIPKFINK